MTSQHNEHEPRQPDDHKSSGSDEHRQLDDPLAMLGQVGPPAPGVLEQARERLWSAVAREMLATPPGSERATGHPGTQVSRTSRPGQAGRPPRE